MAKATAVPTFVDAQERSSSIHWVEAFKSVVLASDVP
jgi:hypothetical protein